MPKTCYNINRKTTAHKVGCRELKTENPPVSSKLGRLFYFIGYFLFIKTMNVSNAMMSFPKDAYVIFITETDVLGGGLLKYDIKRVIAQNGQDFNDGSHIVYVNGAKRGNDSELARLMQDFFCSNPDDMHNQKLAQRARYLKFNEGGVTEMCELMEELAREEAERAAKKATLKEKRRIAKGLLKDGISVTIVVKNTGLSNEEVEKIAARLGKKIA